LATAKLSPGSLRRDRSRARDQELEDVPSAISADERRRVLLEWNDTAADYPLGAPLNRFVERTVRQRPDQIALVCEGESLSYDQLNSRANRLARAMLARGVGRDVPVGVCAERSLELVVALLGILKAGGAYVPLDPSYPTERLKAITGGSSPPLILTQDSLRGRLEGLSVPVFRLDCDWHEIEHYADSDLVSSASPSDLAYVIYTSGSTGTPKGVMNTHIGICNRLLWMQDAYRLATEDRVLQKTPYSFDVSVWEFFWPLIIGARLVLARPGGHSDPAYLVRLIRDAGITVLHFVPSMLQAFLEEPGLESACRTVRHVFASGESLPEPVARRCLERIPARLHNLYGPTEAAVDATFWECRREDAPGPVPIGRPISNMRTYVLDSRMEPLPVGVAGELFLAGIGVARGYLGQPKLTSERFLSDPFVDDPVARMYRTGDLARWRPDGELEFLGRIDHQVKVRGFRIELGEIEAALARIAGIRQAAVTAHEVRPGDTRLFAYIVATAELDNRVIRAGLARMLPEYMTPSAFIRIAALPLTSSGKVDRKALPTPSLGRDARTTYAAPRNPLEEGLCRIWCESLGVDRIGIHDNFFELGGNSLLAARVAARVSAFLARPVSVRTLFEFPTIATFAPAVDSGTNGRGERESALDPIPRAPEGDVEASFAQQRLWFVDQLEGPGLTAYNIVTATRLEGQLEAEALRVALQDLVARHEPLRTTFAIRDGKPVMVIHSPGPLELPSHDIRHVDADNRELEAERLARCEAEHPFDLARDALLRAALVRTGDREHILLLTVHHVAADGWSLTIIWRELAELYTAYRERRTASLRSLAVSYTDYASWQRRVLLGERLNPLLGYWREHLRGLEPLELPADRPRPPTLSYRGDRLDFELSAPLVDRLRALCRDLGATPHMALLAAFQAVLGRIAGRENFAVGVPYEGRLRTELEGLVGLFVNTLVLRADLAGRPTFRELLARTRYTSLDAQDHQDLPFERLVEELHPERQRNRTPLVQVIFQLLEEPRPDFTRTGITATRLPDPLQRARFDLELCVRPRDDRMIGELDYSTDLFDRPTIERFARLYRLFLEAALANPDVPTDEITLLTPEERELVLVRWNDTSTELPTDCTVASLFSEQVSRAPDATALVFGALRMTYAELDARAERVASRLCALGACRESVVAICLPRSPEQIVGSLGILKAGAAYLPLDLANPPERNAFLLRDANAVVLVTDRNSLASLPRLGIPTVLTEDLGADLDDPSEARCEKPFPRVASADSLAYVMYTSGSTGEPKGVMVEHRSIIRLVKGQHFAAFGPDRVFLQLAPVAFDASTFEIWGPLLNGGTLVIAPDGLLDLGRIGELISSHGVTTVWLTAGLFNAIIDTRPEALRGAEEIITGGEALSVRHVRMAFERLGPETRIINGYGPTECTTFACCHVISPDDPAPTGTIPIGRPIANTTAYVLDDRGQPVPIGVAGELYVGGPGVARGYVGRPELTDERIIVSPFRTGERLYRTGDRVRWLPNGTLEFLGRLDGQAKLRGFRIEPGEVEAALNRHPDVSRSAVVVRDIQAGDRQLVAYWSPRPEAHHANPDLAAYLRGLLPAYMIPSAFLRLDSLPLTINGKLDRGALPGFYREARLQADRVAPRDALEARLADIWSKLLGIPEPGACDSFFDLGGHSLLAISLLAAIEREFGQRISVATFFECPTIEALAKGLRTSSRQPARAVATRLNASESGVALVFPPSVFGHCAEGIRLSRLLPPNVRAYAISIAGDEPYWKGCHTLSDIARGFVSALREATPNGPYVLVGFSFAGRVAFEMARLMDEAGLDVAHLVIIDTSIETGRRRVRDRVVRDLPSMLTNLPAKLSQDILASPSKLLARMRRALNSGASALLARPRDPESGCLELGDERLDSLALPQSYRRRLDASLRAFWAYRPNLYHGDATVLAGQIRPLIHRAGADLGWRPWIGGRLTLRTVPGYHDNLFAEPQIGRIAEEIVALVERLKSEPSAAS
jgi:amino acid adenylation domain-containing protein